MLRTVFFSTCVHQSNILPALHNIHWLSDRVMASLKQMVFCRPTEAAGFRIPCTPNRAQVLGETPSTGRLKQPVSLVHLLLYVHAFSSALGMGRT